MTERVGTFRYMAPEVFTSTHYGRKFFDICITHSKKAKADVFSFGILFWVIVTAGGVPYSDHPELQEYMITRNVVENHMRPTIPDSFQDEELVGLVSYFSFLL